MPPRRPLGRHRDRDTAIKGACDGARPSWRNGGCERISSFGSERLRSASDFARSIRRPDQRRGCLKGAWLGTSSLGAFREHHLQRAPLGQPSTIVDPRSLLDWGLLAAVLATDPPPDVIVVARGERLPFPPLAAWMNCARTLAWASACAFATRNDVIPCYALSPMHSKASLDPPTFSSLPRPVEHMASDGITTMRTCSSRTPKESRITTFARTRSRQTPRSTRFCVRALSQGVVRVVHRYADCRRLPLYPRALVAHGHLSRDVALRLRRRPPARHEVLALFPVQRSGRHP